MFDFTLTWERGTDLENPLGYFKNPKDNRLEVVSGISRRHNSDWHGWKLIDEVKNNTDNILDFQQNINKPSISNAIDNFYSEQWTKYMCEEIPTDVAVALFDTSFVTEKAIWLLRKTINFLISTEVSIQANIPYYTSFLNDENLVDENNEIGNQVIQGINLVSSSVNTLKLVDTYLAKRIKYKEVLQDKRPFYKDWDVRTANLCIYVNSGFDKRYMTL